MSVNHFDLVGLSGELAATASYEIASRQLAIGKVASTIDPLALMQHLGIDGADAYSGIEYDKPPSHANSR